MRTLAPRLAVLPKSQQMLWSELASVPSQFTLYGGTAIALHLGHRQSIDFDFFGSQSFSPDHLYHSIPFLSGSEILQQAKDTLTCLLNRNGFIKVSFFGLPHLKRVEEPFTSPDNQLKVASPLDLFGTKALVIQQRSEAKDYIDIDALLGQGITLSEALIAAKKIYGAEFNPQISLKALCYFEDGDLNLLSEPLRKRLIAAAKSLDLRKL